MKPVSSTANYGNSLKKWESKKNDIINFKNNFLKYFNENENRKIMTLKMVPKERWTDLSGPLRSVQII